jgi:hypothetical protein
MVKNLQPWYEIRHIKQCVGRHLVLKKATYLLLQLLDLRGTSEVVKDIQTIG